MTKTQRQLWKSALFSLISVAIVFSKILKCEEVQDQEALKSALKDVFVMEIDKDKDGLASFEELRNYLNELNDRTIEYNVDRQWHLYSPQIHEVFSWEGYEPERKEVLTWELYFNQTYPELTEIDIGIPLKKEQDFSRIVITSEDKPEQNSTSSSDSTTSDDKTDDPQLDLLKKMAHRANERWKLADENGDTLLTRDEFKSLWHPEEASSELQDLFVKEATEDIDSNKNSKIELEEFISHLKELDTDPEGQKENFDKFLDKNKDGALDESEIRMWLIPEKSKKMELEAKRLLDIGDRNEDFNLSQLELIENYEQYVSLLPPEYWAVEGDDEEYSDQQIEEEARHTTKPHDEL